MISINYVEAQATARDIAQYLTGFCGVNVDDDMIDDLCTLLYNHSGAYRNDVKKIWVNGDDEPVTFDTLQLRMVKDEN